MTWPEARFEALYAEPSRNGVYKSKEHHGSGAKIVNMGELFAHEFVGPQEMSRLTMSAQELEKSGLRDGDLLFGRRSLVESGAGKCSIVEGVDEPTTFESSIIRARLDPERCDPRFYYYWFRSHQGRGRIRSIVSGTNVKGIRGSDLKNLPVVQPDVSTQRRIVDTIRPYDDLIENNRRRIALLEEAARLLYREWFVHFRFPGHEHVEIIDGLPEGWERRTLAELADDVSYGYTASADYEIDGPRFLRITDIVGGPINWSNVPRCPISPEKQDRFLLAADDVVVARTGATTGWARRVGRQRESAVFASYLVRFRFSEAIHPAIAAVFLQSKQYKAFIKGNLGGAAQPNAGAKVLGSATMPVAPPSLQRNFAEAVSPMFDQIDLMSEQNEKLAHARDLLLPRLMNGKITV